MVYREYIGIALPYSLLRTSKTFCAPSGSFLKQGDTKIDPNRMILILGRPKNSNRNLENPQVHELPWNSWNKPQKL